MQAAWDATTLRLQGAPGVQQQAAALLMNRHRPNGALQATVPWSAANLSQLVALALGSADPVVLQWALRACGTPGQNPSCQGLSARAWPDAEPGNLLAWLALLSDEPQAREEALQGMVQATRAATTWARPAVLVQAARPADLSPGLRLAFELHLVGLALADVLLPWGGLLKTCSDAHLADPLRRGQCQVIAQRLVDRGQDLITVGMGNAMGKRLGWPAQRDQDHQALVKAGVAGALDLFLVPLSPDCQARVLQHHWQQVDSLGEVEMARQQLRADALAAGAKASASAPGATAPVR